MEPTYTKIDESSFEISEPQIVKVSDIVTKLTNARKQVATMAERKQRLIDEYDSEKNIKAAQIQAEIDDLNIQIAFYADQLAKAAEAGVDEAVEAVSAS